MWPYWLMFLSPAAAAMMGRRTPGPEGAAPGAGPNSVAWLLSAAAITLLVGCRLNVGSDWWQYLDHLDSLRGVRLSDVFVMSDPGYQLANWLSNEIGGGILGVNLICGGLFTAGLARFCRGMPRPWLALAVAVPYLIIVVGMGYSRQGVALGLCMLGLASLQRRSTAWFVVGVVLGATFHKTAVLMLPIAALAGTQNRYWTAAWVGAVSFGAYVLLLQDSVDALYYGYIESEYQSEGALIRLLMNALPAAILLVRWKHFQLSPAEGPLWRWIAIISLALLAILFVSPSSTAIDRLALYMLPLQLVVFSRLPEAMGDEGSTNQGWTSLVLLYYALVFFVWLNFASHSSAWLPYRSYLLDGA